MELLNWKRGKCQVNFPNSLLHTFGPFLNSLGVLHISLINLKNPTSDHVWPLVYLNVCESFPPTVCLTSFCIVSLQYCQDYRIVVNFLIQIIPRVPLNSSLHFYFPYFSTSCSSWPDPQPFLIRIRSSPHFSHCIQKLTMSFV